VQIELKNKLAFGFILLWMAMSFGFSHASPRDGLGLAQTAFSRGHADDALRAINATLNQNNGNAAAWNLQCRVYLAQGRWEDAIGSCQHAVQLAPGNSGYHLWLGRAYGEKASHAKLLAAYKTAKLVRAEFETAVSLDGQNGEALSDLGQYYVEAPEFLGGGLSKAEGMAERLNTLDPVRAYELQAQIAEKKRDFAGAEQNWRSKITASQASPEATAQAWMDLGSFYRRRKRWDEMLAALKNGAAADTDHGPALVDGASTLIQSEREPQLAEQWLREYLDGNALSETAPAFAVHAELGDLLRKQGDESAAEREFAAAHALSANYAGTVAISTGD
jgi:tetratricopeptide (TPR) repeat protein